jgi:superfamily I DNA/RNA helicase
MKAVRMLKDEPYNPKYTEKLEGTNNSFRYKAGKPWRLLFSYNDTTLHLKDVLDRDESYSNSNIDLVKKNNTPRLPGDLVWEDRNIAKEETSSDGIQQTGSACSGILSREKLEKWRIPEKYWPKLLTIRHPDDLLEPEVDTPWEHIYKIIDLLTDSIEENSGPTFQLSDGQLEDYVEGKLSDKGILYQLSPEQEEILNQKDGPLLVKGGPGSGKSLLALYRVKQLVDNGDRNDGARNILFTTYTSELLSFSREQLSELIRRDLDSVSVDMKTVDEIATVFYREKHDTPSICETPVQILLLETAIDLLLQDRSFSQTIRSKIVNNSKLTNEYLIEEFALVIDARHTIKTGEDYRECERKGRGLDLKRGQRDAVWRTYEKWTQLMSETGFTTREKIIDSAFEIAKTSKKKRYQYVIIDEAQDLSPTALSFLSRLCEPSGLHLAADTEQSLYQRSFSWDLIQSYLQLEKATQPKTKRLRKTFRNTQQIGKACANLINSQELEIFSSFQGDKPKLIITDDISQQVSRIKAFFESASKQYRFPKTSGVILTPSSSYGALIAQHLSNQGLPSKLISNDKRINQSFVKVLDIHLAKGLEFPFVAVVGLQESIFPNISDQLPKEEAEELKKQQKHLLYVACSRASHALLVCASKSRPSEFIDSISDYYWEKEII